VEDANPLLLLASDRLIFERHVEDEALREIF